MPAADPITIITLLMAFAGVVGTAWWRLQSMVNATRKEADTKFDALSARTSLVESRLAEHRTHVAETYISKQGLRETIEPLATALATINVNLAHLNERIDRLMDRQPPPSR